MMKKVISFCYYYFFSHRLTNSSSLLSGRAYLDAVNNVAHVGHTHPRIIKAAAEHMSLLNTNTRYLSEVPLHLAARLRALLPSQLSVCYFVCSGSEANDLALRIAAAHTKKKGVLVIDGRMIVVAVILFLYFYFVHLAAYHGHTAALIDVSPYKHNGPGGQVCGFFFSLTFFSSPLI